MESHKVLIIIPAYNEAENIASVLNEIAESAPWCDKVVISDGSEDDTAAIVAKTGTRVIWHPVNLGYGAAIQTGLRYALAKGYDTAVLIDGDGQHDAKDIPGLLNALRGRSCDVVIGSRFLQKNNYRPSFMRYLGMRFFSLLASFIIRQTILDTTSGFQALNRRAIEFLSENYPVDFPDAQVIILLCLNGFKVVEVAANFRPRLKGKSMYNFASGIFYYFKVMLSILIVLLKVSILKGGKEKNVF